MTDLDNRLRSLAVALDPAELTSPDALRERARRNRMRRRLGGGGVILAALVLAASAMTIRTSGENRSEFVAGPGSTIEQPGPTSPGQRSVGDVEGVAVEVSPSQGLADGQLVTVRIEGGAALPGASLVMCRGDVQQSTASRLCDVLAISDSQTDVTSAVQEVRVSRFLAILYGPGNVVDCATDVHGCVVGLGNPGVVPVKGVVVPIGFTPAGPPSPPLIQVSPATGLDAGSIVTVGVQGLRAERSYSLVQCTADRRVCSDEVQTTMGVTLLRSDASGAGTAQWAVQTALYGYGGRVDCTAEPCFLGLFDRRFAGREGAGEEGFLAAPIEFAAQAVAPVPTLRIEPRGPWVAGQEVSVLGSGFPAGSDLGSSLGICPAHLDTAIEERCTYPLFSSVVAASDGAFRASMVLGDLTDVGRCQDQPAGCVLAWVLNRGPIAASTPLRFR